MQWDGLAVQKRQFLQQMSPDDSAYVRQYFNNLDQNMKQNLQRLCRAELDRRLLAQRNVPPGKTSGPAEKKDAPAGH